MEKVIITGFTTNKEGVILETNIPAKMRGLNVKGKTSWVSWDKIGKLLFEDYTDEIDVSERDSLRQP